jgi:hypothetical protein
MKFRQKFGLLQISTFSTISARNGHGGAVTACLLSGAKRKTFTWDEYFAF